jgi:hypothetical protein
VLDTEPCHTYRSIGQSVVASVPPEVMLQFGDTVKKLLAEGKACVSEPTKKFELADLSSVKKLHLIGIGGFGQVRSRHGRCPPDRIKENVVSTSSRNKAKSTDKSRAFVYYC